MRNNNPFNLVKTSITWYGKIPASDNMDGHFEQFYSLEWGVRAGMRDIVGDIKNKGLNTIELLISAFAPAFENNTNAYISFVSNKMGVSKYQQLGTNKSTIIALSKAIVEMENGTAEASLINDDVYNEAWRLHTSGEAFVDRVVQTCQYCGHALIGTALFFFTYFSLTF